MTFISWLFSTVYNIISPIITVLLVIVILVVLYVISDGSIVTIRCVGNGLLSCGS